MVGPVTSAKHYFDTLSERFVASAAKGVNAVFQFELTGDGGGNYFITVNDGTMSVTEGTAPSPTTTIKVAAADYVKIVNGQLNGMMAVMKGQMKVSGNVLLAQKMQAMFPIGK